MDPDPRRRCDVDRWRGNGTSCHAPRRRAGLGKRDEAKSLVIFGDVGLTRRRESIPFEDRSVWDHGPRSVIEMLPER
jgi:hypothetical protein